MSLPPPPKRFDLQDDLSFSEAVDGAWIADDDALEYGRQCWNAAIDAAINAYGDSVDCPVSGMEELKII